jgi:hypothetical protein
MTAAFFGGNNPGQGGVGTSGTGYAADNKNLGAWTGSNWISVLNNSAALPNGVGYVGNVGANGIRVASGVQTFAGVQPHASVEIPLTYARADDAVFLQDTRWVLDRHFKARKRYHFGTSGGVHWVEDRMLHRATFVQFAANIP